MARTVEVIYGQTGQTVELIPAEWPEGVPSSASCSVYEGLDGLDETAEFSPSVTVDSVSTTVDAASGYSETQRNKLNLTATTSIVIGRPYLVENAGSQRELVVPKKIVSADYIETESDLAYDYASGATFKGVRMTFPVDNTWVAAESNLSQYKLPPYVAVWTYTVNSVVRRAYTYIRLVRFLWKDLLSIEDIKEIRPDIQADEWRETRGQQFKHFIDATCDAVRADILAEGYEPARIRDTEIIAELLRRKFFAMAGQEGVVPSGRDAELYVANAKAEYESLRARTLGALKMNLDEGTEGNASEQPVRTFSFSR